MWGRRASSVVPVGTASLEHLLAMVARGDHEAFEAVYDRSAPQVYGLVRRVLRDPAQAEEVAQEVFLEVWRSAASFDASRGGAMTWLLTIAHRRAVDRVRSAQAATDRDVRFGRQQVERDVDVVSEAVEQRLETAAVREALGSLTALQRQALTLAYYGGYTHTEVAELLGVPLGTVKTRIRDGLIRLRDLMGVTA
jgi:RNA polymerase sigma-70 factor (ECF subfamily)